MELSQQKKELFPEERVRQDLFRLMVEEKGYVASHIVIEKELSLLPHIERGPAIPNRRVDMLVYETKTVLPLLLVECKAVKLSEKVIGQVLGYNQFVKASFIAVVNQVQVITGWLDNNEFKFVSRLPDYDELVIKSRAFSRA